MVANPSTHLNGHSTPAVQDPHAWRKDYEESKRNGWMQAEPPHLHSVKWVDADGIEHLHVVRGDSLDTVLHEVKVVVQLVRASKAKHATPEATPAGQPSSLPAEGWCSVHNSPMQRHSNAKGAWWSHKASDGQWCRGAQ